LFAALFSPRRSITSLADFVRLRSCGTSRITLPLPLSLLQPSFTSPSTYRLLPSDMPHSALTFCSAALLLLLFRLPVLHYVPSHACCAHARLAAWRIVDAAAEKFASLACLHVAS